MNKASARRKPQKGLVDAESHAQGFRKAREARRTELAEDYVELIADFVETEGEARQVDIARRLGVSQPTVAKMLNRLAEDGLISRQRYRSIFLTEAGKQLAEESRRRHELVEAFLLAIGVSDEVARTDAEGIEHHVSAETLETFRRFLRAQDRAG